MCFPHSVKNHSVFSSFSHTLLVLNEVWVYGVCVCVQACAHMCVCACVHVWAIWFFPLLCCVQSGREGMCLFSPWSLLCSAPARSEQGENKGGAKGGESAPTVDLTIVGGRNTIPIDALDAWLKPPEALGRGLIQGLMWPGGMGWKMGVEPIVRTVGTLSPLGCFNTTLNHWLCELDGLSGCLFFPIQATREVPHVRDPWSP